MSAHGTDAPPAGSPADREARRWAGLVHHLTFAGWLLLGGEIGFLLFQLDRVRQVDGTRFATAWDQRIEVMSFVMFPANLPALAPAAAVAVVATVLAGSDPGPWLVALLRSVGGIAVALVLIGGASIVEVLTRDGESAELGPIFLRAGGMSLAAGIAYACWAAATHHRR